MARIRSLHPGIFTDEAFVSVSRDARLLFIGLWCEADDRGVFEWKPLTLKMRLFAADAIDVALLLDELDRAGMVRQFEADGKRFGVIRNFCRFQRPKSPKVVHPLPEALHAFVALSGELEPGAPLNYSRDVTAADRKRRQRENERQRGESGGNGHGSSVTDGETDNGYTPQDDGSRHGSDVTNGEDGGSRDDTDSGNGHGSSVTSSEVSRQMKEVGGRREEEKEEKEEKEEPAGSSKKSRKTASANRGTRVDGFEPDVAWAIGAGLSAERARVSAERFLDHWRGISGQRGVKLDWPATWRNWVRNDLEKAGGSASHPANNPANAVSDDDWRKRLDHARRTRNWSTTRWGPFPGQPGCTVPPALLVPGDGEGWEDKGLAAATAPSRQFAA